MSDIGIISTLEQLIQKETTELPCSTEERCPKIQHSTTTARAMHPCFMRHGPQTMQCSCAPHNQSSLTFYEQHGPQTMQCPCTTPHKKSSLTFRKQHSPRTLRCSCTAQHMQCTHILRAAWPSYSAMLLRSSWQASDSWSGDCKAQRST